jgi:hypothetical protein
VWKLDSRGRWAARQSINAPTRQPTTYFLRSLRIIYAYTGKLQVALWFKDRGLGDSSEAMVVPHIEGGGRKHKPMELRLQRAGLMPWG